MNKSYLKFDKTRMVNLEYSLDREILRANRKGAYHCTTLVECNTRKQHGLLVMPVPEMDDSDHVLLSSFDETVIQHGAEFNLGLHKYDGDNYSPMGHKYIREFDCESCPKTIYRIGGVILSKEKLFSLDDNMIFIRYTLLDAHSPTTLRFRPFLAFRSINDLSTENSMANLSYNEVEQGISTCMYDKYPTLYMQFSKQNQFVYEPNWYKGLEYQQDKQDGVPYKEDLYVPGYFEMSIEKGETIIFAAGDRSVDTASLLQRFDEEVVRRTPRSSFYNCLKNSAHQFFVRPSKDELFLLEGYPWFGVNAREQFMSLPGLTLAVDRDAAFENIMDSNIPYIKKLMNGEPITGIVKNMEDPDVLLWCVWALKKFANYAPETCYSKYGSLVKEITEFILSNKHPNLKVTKNKLLYSDGRDKAISWMKATINGKPVVPRTGYLVEFNALWYNCLMFYLEIVEHNKDEKTARELKDLIDWVKESFLDTFVNNVGYLFDYVDGDYPNWSVRPNMIFAVSMDYSPLTRRQCKSVLDMSTKELLTPKGIRSLSPKSEGYQPYYRGDLSSRNYAYANGTCHPLFLASFFDAYIKVHQRSAYSFIERILITIEEEMANNCIGSLSQVYDGNPPYKGRGAFSYGLSVAGVLRALQIKETLEQEFDTDYY